IDARHAAADSAQIGCQLFIEKAAHLIAKGGIDRAEPQFHHLLPERQMLMPGSRQPVRLSCQTDGHFNSLSLGQAVGAERARVRTVRKSKFRGRALRAGWKAYRV